MSTFSIDDALAEYESGLNTNEEAETGAVDTATDTAEEISQDDPDLEGDTEDAATEPSEDGDEDEGDEAANEPSLEAPELWNAGKKELFAKLPTELKQYVRELSDNAQTFVEKKQLDADNKARVSENEAKTFIEVRSVMEQRLNETAQLHINKWANVPWEQLQHTDPERFTAYLGQYQQERAGLEQLNAARVQADNIALAEFHKEEAVALSKFAETDLVAKQLTDPATAPKLISELAQYLIENGVPKENLGKIPAKQMIMAQKAKLYDEAFASKKAVTQQAQPKSTQAQGVKMRAPTTSAQTAPVTALAKREAQLSKSGKLEDALDLMMARQAKQRSN